MLNKTEVNKTLAKLGESLRKVAAEQNMPEPFQQALQLIRDDGIDAKVNDLKLEVENNFNRNQELIAKAISCFSRAQTTFSYLKNGGLPTMVWTHKTMGVIETSTEDYLCVQVDSINTINQKVTGVLPPEEEHWLDLID